MTLPTVSLRFTVNGAPRELEVPALRRLLDVLRDDLGLKGTKEGCGEGECGACSVILNGRLVNSCLVPAVQANGAEILTVEGVGRLDPSGLHPIQTAMMAHGGAQCGICTPGMIMAGYDFVRRAAAEGRELDEGAVRVAIAGNLCRCTGYVKIVDAIVDAALRLAEDATTAAGEA